MVLWGIQVVQEAAAGASGSDRERPKDRRGADTHTLRIPYQLSGLHNCEEETRPTFLEHTYYGYNVARPSSAVIWKFESEHHLLEKTGLC